MYARTRLWFIYLSSWPQKVYELWVEKRIDSNRACDFLQYLRTYTMVITRV